MKIRIQFIFVFIFISLTAIKAQNTKDLFQNANTYYQQKQYDEAAKLYLQLLEKESNNVNARFNLGNTYFHLKNYTEAIVQYEKVRKLEPDNKYILHNIQLTNNKLFSKMELSKDFFVTQSVKKFFNSKSSKFWSIALIVFLWTALFALLLYFFFKKSYFIKPGILALLLGLICAIFTYNTYQTEHKNTFAIVIQKNVLLKKSPVENTKTIDTIIAGTKVELLDNDKNWFNIKLPNDKKGWIENSNLEKI